MTLNPLAFPKGVKYLCELCQKPAYMQCTQCRVTYYWWVLSFHSIFVMFIENSNIKCTYVINKRTIEIIKELLTVFYRLARECVWHFYYLYYIIVQHDLKITTKYIYISLLIRKIYRIIKTYGTRIKRWNKYVFLVFCEHGWLSPAVLNTKELTGLEYMKKYARLSCH